MKRIILNILLVLAACAGSAFAAGTEGVQGGLLSKLFLAFLAMIIVCQLVPGLVLFATMLRELFHEGGRNGSLMRKKGKSV